MNNDYQQLVDLDQQLIWHPYSSQTNPPPVYPVVSASGVRLTLADGRELIDGMASWWCAIHGYNHPRLNQAVINQLGQMSHVMFGGITHPPAVRLCQKLVDISPPGLTKVFLADSGSISVEVAIKMALQYWLSSGQAQRNRLLTVRGGYHGDTFATMAVCDPVNGMHHWFSEFLTQHLFAPLPPAGFDRALADGDLGEFEQILQLHGNSIAAVILEPIVQGAGGMRFYAPAYLHRVRQLCDHYDVLLIADEIATGFGRTGALFACNHANISPDIMCIGKALTGGYMTLAATLCSDKVANGIGQGQVPELQHGPTFMGNPLACAVANASIDLLLEQPWQTRVQTIGELMRQLLAPAAQLPAVAEVRVLGAIGVIELHQPVAMARIQQQFVEHGIWVRPFGKLVYIMPPYIISDADLAYLCDKMVQVIATI